MLQSAGQPFLSQAGKWKQKLLPEVIKSDPMIEKAFVTLDTLALDDKEREIYEAQLKWLRDEAAAVEKAIVKGIDIGIEKFL